MLLRQVPSRRRTPRRLTAVAAIAALVLAAPPAAAGADTAGGSGSTLTVAASQPVDSLSPFLAQRAISTNIHRLIYDFLTNYDAETNEPIPALAESWEASDDQLTWTYTIRDGLEWSDGEPLTADDVAWTFTTMMEDEAAATANGNFVANFEQVTAPDEHTVVIELREPQATMLALDVPILPRHVWEDVDDYAEFNNDDLPIVGSGPFVLTEHRPNQSITLEANENYWRGAPGFERLVFTYYNDQDAMVEALRSGEVSFVPDLTPAQADSLEGNDAVTVNAADGKRFNGFTINPGARTADGDEFGDGHPALQDRVVRQAIMRAIDKDALVETVHGGYAEAAEGYIPARYSDYYWAPEDGDRLDFDPDAANEMLDEAGYERGDDGVRVSPDGDPLTFRMFVHNDRPAFVQTGQFMEEWLADIGIEVEGNYVDPNQITDRLNNGEYDLIFTSWNVNPDPDFVLGIHTCDALPEQPGTMRSDSFFCDERYDELYDQQIQEYDPARRAEIVREMQQILYDEAVVNVLTYPDMLEAYRSDQIADIQVQPEPGGNIWNQDGYWSWWSATPVEAAGGDGGGVPVTAIVGIAAAVLVLGGGIGFLVLRRRSATAEDRE
ncbi:ABC transporter substrate-binding protein [Marinitenerispora sediminis]|uniref:ABC transporter substrate-binding protein n=1 Tax=Marinitenerispora sediminis TaxID=1931232 RepID=A0A368T699_9ACTN|nr:ABC transporter substrate-binding protein [Marinitenerispora sediminis]RCV55361.1 ABC transporter substrate-binding protein [Marinitenerispora sediminis]RCV59152.1 ABC transporter substrate-binding protein [Marinitenerispora sediminis]RCV59178.1 ABC transporter substrate-binding protein [Marinitenerispora sediminis]